VEHYQQLAARASLRAIASCSGVEVE